MCGSHRRSASLICRHQGFSPGPRAGQIPCTSRGPSGQLGDQRENDQTDERDGAPCPIVTAYQRASGEPLHDPCKALRIPWHALPWPAGGTSAPGISGTFGSDRRSGPMPPTRPALRGPPASTQLARCASPWSPGSQEINELAISPGTRVVLDTQIQPHYQHVTKYLRVPPDRGRYQIGYRKGPLRTKSALRSVSCEVLQRVPGRLKPLVTGCLPPPWMSNGGCD